MGRYESVLWFGEMPQEPECRSPAWNDEFTRGDPWLTVHKQQLPKPPALPKIVVGWVEEQALRRAVSEMPALRPIRLVPDLEAEVGLGEDPPLVETRLEDHPEVVRAYDQFRPSWEAWSKEYQRRDLIQSVYAELFRLHTQVQKQGEIVELVLGLGLLVWPRRVQCEPEKQRFLNPLVRLGPPVFRDIAGKYRRYFREIEPGSRYIRCS